MTRTSRNKVVVENLPLVTSRVKKINNGIFCSDLFQEGCLGLIYAVEKYNEDREAKLSTYAVRCIDGYIRGYINNNLTVRPKRNNREGYIYPQIYYTSSRLSDDSNHTLENILYDSYDSIQEVINDIFKEAFLGALTPQEREVIDLVAAGNSQRKISEKLCISQPKVHRIIKRAYRKYTQLVEW